MRQSETVMRPRTLSADTTGELLVAAVALMPDDDPARPQAVADAVEHWLPMANRIAGSFRSRTSEPEDLRQVAMTALVQAVVRYRPEAGAFPSYAVPCISGEIRRWLRDHRGLVHVPRRIVEVDVQAVVTEERLGQQFGRVPSAQEIGDALGVSAETVALARAGRAARTTSTVEADGRITSGSDDERSGAAGVAYSDPDLLRVEQRADMRPLLASLDRRSRQVMHLRFFEERTQSEIAREIGVSQVQVSRIIRRSLALMRERMRAGSVGGDHAR